MKLNTQNINLKSLKQAVRDGKFKDIESLMKHFASLESLLNETKIECVQLFDKQKDCTHERLSVSRTEQTKCLGGYYIYYDIRRCLSCGRLFTERLDD